MAQDACPTCKKKIDLDATVCPYCQSSFTDSEMKERRDVHSANMKNGGIGCLVLIGLIAAISMCSGSGSEKKTSTAKPEDNKAAAITLYNDMISATSNCDAAASQMAAPLKDGNIVGAYRAAEVAEAACLGTPTKIRDISMPDGFDDKRKADAEKALEACENAYVMKWSGAKSLKSALDGDMRPSVIAEMQDTAKGAQAGQFLCAGGLMTVAMSYGATNKDLGLEDSAAKP